MIVRLGFIGRLLAIGIFGFSALLIMLGVSLYLLGQQETALQQRFPQPEQIMAVARLIEQTPREERDGVLTALNGADFSVAVAAGPPVADAESRELPRIEGLLSRYADGLARREVLVEIPDAGMRARPLLDAWAGLAPVQMQIGLADGNHLVIAAKGAPLRRPLYAPTGFWLAAVGVLISAVTLFSLFRAASPLRRLTAALESFSETASPVPILPSGPADVQRLIGTVNRMQERLSTLLKGRAMLAGAISHDLRTYLTRMQLRIDAIEDEEERRAAEADIETMTNIIENALAFAQSTSSSGVREAVDLAEIVGREAERHGESMVVCRIETSPVLISGDRVALQRVIANLIANAMHYAGDAQVTLSVAGRYAELVVDDHGPGIPCTERETVFEPFYRLETSRNRGSGGTGLGLALTRQIVEAHGGHITAGSAPGGGASMRVLLPIA